MDESAKELQQLVDALPQYENQIRYWESQLEAISNVRSDIFQAQDTLNGMMDSKDGMELMVPVGHNTSIFTNVNDLDRVLVGIGSRVYLETTREDSIKRLDKRLKGIEEAGKTYQESLQKSQKDYADVRERAELLSSNRGAN
ncbi:MAG: prefoldin subunit alpha [Methanobacteriota archaeon]|jgi:prefoldin alpha subunit|nr:MAG: prefoldin subunit alpha [Euryarchaeota archaeon]|tara:strand:- start:345 stop:770 length:426 start_codon:yes stop_codon:yes gene_type:complete